MKKRLSGNLKVPENIILSPRNTYNHRSDPKKLYDCIIVGAGIAGFSCAMYAARLGMKVLVIGEMSGGKITLTEAVENYPGFVSVGGLRLAELIENHALDYDVDIMTDIVDGVSVKKGAGFSVSVGRNLFKGKSLVIATGTTEKKLGVPGEEKLTGKGVSYCALCDATFVKGKTAVIVGGGDSAVKEANLLIKYAKKVHIINNEAKLHAEKHNMDLLDGHIKKRRVFVHNSASVVSIDGKSSVESITFKKDGKKGDDVVLSADWVFIYIGQVPRIVGRELGMKINKAGEVVVDVDCRTSLKSVYAAGDVTSTSWKQAIIAAAQGVTTAYSAYQDLQKSV